MMVCAASLIAAFWKIFSLDSCEIFSNVYINLTFAAVFVNTLFINMKEPLEYVS